MSDFWARIGLQDQDGTMCIAAVQAAYERPGVEVEVDELEHQGWCSYTLVVTQTDRAGRASVIVQLRARGHAMDGGVAAEAERVYAPLAPGMRALDMCLPAGLGAWEMNCLPGRPLSLLLPLASAGADVRAKQQRLVCSFAGVVARSWPTPAAEMNGKRRDSVLDPLGNAGNPLSRCEGKVGAVLVRKLDLLTTALPSPWLRERARSTMERFQSVMEGGYPVVLNHGDLIPGNILVDQLTWEVTGVVDWAEAERLPFGMCLYGLEHLLGWLESHALPPTASPSTRSFSWIYHPDAPSLRELFWDALVSLVPELEGRRDEVAVVRDAGVLLWHGYAWDGGAISRVVDAGVDGEEVAKLSAFLGYAESRQV